MKLVLRDRDGVRDDLAQRLLTLKRGDLGAVLAGAPRPPPLGVLMFGDVERGEALYGECVV